MGTTPRTSPGASPRLGRNDSASPRSRARSRCRPRARATTTAAIKSSVPRCQRRCRRDGWGPSRSMSRTGGPSASGPGVGGRRRRSVVEQVQQGVTGPGASRSASSKSRAMSSAIDGLQGEAGAEAAAGAGQQGGRRLPTPRSSAAATSATDIPSTVCSASAPRLGRCTGSWASIQRACSAETCPVSGGGSSTCSPAR